ncbi:MAG: hypothetical protein R3C29_11150 [Dehalococcoidia bacterium]
MRKGTGNELGSPTVARLLLAALLPSLLFIGHWQLPLSIPIPGTVYSLGAGPQAAHDHADHASHCHADAAGCSSAPQSAQTAAANLHELALALGGLSALALLALAAYWRPTRIHGFGPELRPPRPLAISP